MSSPYVGEIRIFAGTFAPDGWLLCQGQLIPISGYDTLFNLIGTIYGGDGVNTFAVPNLSSRVPVHVAAGYPLGATGGAETVTLTPQNLPVHTHPVGASSAAADTVTPSGAVWAVGSANAYATAAPDVSMNSASVAPVGGSQPHNNMPPVVALNFIINFSGTYPTQN